MADKTDVFVRALRRKDNVEMVLGRKLIEANPHKFEEIGPTKKASPVVAEKVVVVPEDSDITMDFDTANFDSYQGKALTTVDEYRDALDDMGVTYKKTHGMPGLKKLYGENK